MITLFCILLGYCSCDIPRSQHLWAMIGSKFSTPIRDASKHLTIGEASCLPNQWSERTKANVSPNSLEWTLLFFQFEGHNGVKTVCQTRPVLTTAPTNIQYMASWHHCDVFFSVVFGTASCYNNNNQQIGIDSEAGKLSIISSWTLFSSSPLLKWYLLSHTKWLTQQTQMPSMEADMIWYV